MIEAVLEVSHTLFCFYGLKFRCWSSFNNNLRYMVKVVLLAKKVTRLFPHGS